MAKAQHTPTPWGYDGDGFDSVAAQHCNTDGYVIFPVDDEGQCDGGSICEMTDCGDEEAEANAAFICKAVNNHESLLAALKAVLQATEDAVIAQASPAQISWFRAGSDTWKKAREAIATAEAQQ